MKLDSKAAAALELPAGKADVIYFDDTLIGFGLRLRAGAGGKVLRSWIVQYRRAGAGRRYLNGSADVLGADKARAAAKEVLAKVALGQDPSADRADRRDADKLTFRKAVEDFLTFKGRHLRPNSFAGTRRYLTGAYFRPLHTMPLDAITRQDVALRLRAISNESGSPTAGQARGQLSSFFTWCMQEGLADANPVIGTRAPAKGKSRERVLDDQELAAIWRASGDDDYGRIVKLLILTGARREEVGGMSWPEFKADGTWTLPAARSKNDRPHSLPMLPMMREIIDTVPKLAGRSRLFGVHSASGFQSWDINKSKLDARLGGAVEPWVLHDVRRTVATGLANLGVLPHTIEAVLGHVGHRAGVAGVYNKSPYANEVRSALVLWHDHLRTLIAGGERKVLAYPQAAS